MLNQLDILISVIQDFYYDCNKLWLNQYPEASFNMKKQKMKDILNKSSLLSNIYSYRTFLLNNSIDSELKLLFLKNNELENANLFVRIKNDNSIQDKIYRYNHEEHHNYGEESINKCLNDILGIRIIVKEDIDYDSLQTYLQNKYDTIRCIISHPEESDYYAVHVYFGRGNNQNFRWELQIWDEKHSKSNEESHRNYKQNYKVWENKIQAEEE